MGPKNKLCDSHTKDIFNRERWREREERGRERERKQPTKRGK